MKNKTYHIITIGCQMNKSDSERLASVLEKQGYKKTENKHQADLVAVNTCGVRQTAEDRIYGLIPDIKRKNKKAKIVLTGCLANRKDVRRRLKDYVDVWLPIDKIFNFQFSIFKQNPIFPARGRTSNFQTNVKGKSDYLKTIPKYNSKFSAYVPIGNGCDNYCSYCVVPYARGREAYRPAQEILAEVRGLVEKGYREIILIAQNVNSYKSQIPNPNYQTNPKSKIKNLQNKVIDFADLLKLVNNLKGDFQIKFLTSHPKDMSDKLIKAIASSQKVCHHIHLPAQAGDDEILRKMNRKYTVKRYIGLIKKIRKALPDVSLTTDIIVGFPGETKKQFNNTVKFFKEIKFDKAYVARYSPRPGTVAFKLDDNVAPAEKKRRWQALNSLLK